MAVLPTPESSIDLRAVTVRPTHGAREHRLRDRLVEEHHCLRFHGIVGKGLLPGSRCTAGPGSRLAAGSRARPGRRRGTAGSGGRRRSSSGACTWSATTPVSSSRATAGAEPGVPGAGPGLRRLSADIQAVHGYPALLAETFVDVSRFTGAG